MALTGYYRNQGLLAPASTPPANYGNLPFADQEAAARAANSPAQQQPGMDGSGWSGVIGGTRVYMGDVPANATQAEAEERFRNDPRYNFSAGYGYMSPETWNYLNPNATAAERKEYQDRYNYRQTQIYNANESLAQSSGLGPLGILGAGILAAAGGAALVGSLGGAGAGAAGAAGGTGSGAAGGAAGSAAGAAGGTAGTAGAAAGTAGGVAGGGAAAGGAIPEIIVTGSSGGLSAGGAAGAAGGAASAGSFWNNMHNAASDTSSLNATNEQYLNNLEAPTAQYGIDWANLIKRGGGLLSGSQGQQQMPMGGMTGGGMPGLMGGGGSVARGVAPQRSRVQRSPLENYMALSRIGLLGDRD